MSPARTLFLCSLLLPLYACDQQPAALPSPTDTPRLPRVEVLRLRPADWQHTIRVYGVVEAVEEVAVSVEFAGIVVGVHFVEGQRVARGALLLELEHGRQTLRVERAESGVEGAAAALQEARSSLKRRRGLAAKSAVSRELLETSEIAVRRAAAIHDDALAALALAQREVADSRVLSPVDGVIDRREVEPGERLTPGQTLASIQVVDAVRIVTFVGERDVNFLSSGAAATVTTPGVRGRRYSGVIESVGVMADPRTGNFPVKLTLSNEDRLLRPGMTARVTLQGLLERDRLLLPDTAVVARDRRKVVYVVATGDGGDVAREVHPILRATTDEQIPVIDGLSSGDRVLVSGLEFVVDGSPIEVVVAPASEVTQQP